MNKFALSDKSKVKESKDTIIQENIFKFIETSLRNGSSTEDVEQVLVQLYSKEFLLSKQVYGNALEEVRKKAASRPTPRQVEDEVESKPKPLFCEDTVIPCKPLQLGS